MGILFIMLQTGNEVEKEMATAIYRDYICRVYGFGSRVRGFMISCSEPRISEFGRCAVSFWSVGRGFMGFHQ